MKYLLDTCVISELIKPKPNPEVIAFIKSIGGARLYLSAVTIGELQKGISKLVNSRKKRQLIIWLEQTILNQFDGHIVPIGVDVSLRWGKITGHAQASGVTLPAIDAMIAATALTQNMVVVTRNTGDLDRCGVETVNPWNL